MKNISAPSLISVFAKILVVSCAIFVMILSSAVLFWTGIAHADNDPLAIKRIIPSGDEIDNQRQIVIQFNRPVVPLGRMERNADELGITITPELKGQWRWLNPSDLAFHIDANSRLEPSTTYKVEIMPAIMTQDGASLSNTVIHTFVTRRPDISYHEFRNWKAPGIPVIALHFNQPVTRDSVEQRIFFSLADNPLYKNPVQVENQPYRSNTRGAVNITANSNSIGAASTDDGSALNNNAIASNKGTAVIQYRKTASRWIIYPSVELPSDSTIRLIANPGIEPASGTEKSVGIKNIVQFDTFPDFEFAGIRCHTITGNDPVIISLKDAASGELGHIVDPRGYTELLFTAPVLFKELKEHLRFLPDLAQGSKDYDPWANSYNGYGLNFAHTKGQFYGVAIPRYLKAWQQYTILEKAPGIRDQFGRRLLTPIDFTFYTDHRRPDYQILHETGVLEKDIDSEVPLVVTNIDQMTISYKTLTGQENQELTGNKNPDHSGQKNPDQSGQDSLDQTVVKSNLRVQDIAYFTPLGVREML
ncbi:MAG: hypothetical protein HQK61_09915, partial [Desulfamplus sp.]|nr:hypothetical protein [Desulfamplus sp.]